MDDNLKNFPKDAFTRSDEIDDREFYATDRFVSHLDSAALRTIEGLIDGLVIEKAPSILDLLASWDSMDEQGNPGSCHPLPVPTYNAFKDGIVSEGTEED